MAKKSTRAGRRKSWKGGKTAKARVARRRTRNATGRGGVSDLGVPQFQG